MVGRWLSRIAPQHSIGVRPNISRSAANNGGGRSTGGTLRRNATASSIAAVCSWLRPVDRRRGRPPRSSACTACGVRLDQTLQKPFACRRRVNDNLPAALGEGEAVRLRAPPRYLALGEAVGLRKFILGRPVSQYAVIHLGSSLFERRAETCRANRRAQKNWNVQLNHQVAEALAGSQLGSRLQDRSPGITSPRFDAVNFEQI